ncbi:ATP synthase subunit g, mitochondrial [Cytospora mali]|uniref:ATP synthase subunit g, mitochondrial n=1 Tax=Cytospora mali TaxID=578113 RepID=A0A194V8Y8_CYTMA|nr:ATP synthase subunit g, mitochondrial [Valsa mali var. pyri (nom. inval.)]
MSTTALARPLLRQNLRFAARRFQSSDAAAAQAKKAAEAAKEQAQNLQAKASQGLSRVASTAGPAIAGAAKGLSGALGRVGGRTGRFVGFVERQVPFVAYYSKVGLELGKLVVQGQKMQPPSVATFQAYFNRALNAVKNPQSLLQSASGTASSLSQVRNLSSAQLVGGGVLLAEVLGFFTVGEIIGRFKLVGYHGETGHAHH